MGGLKKRAALPVPHALAEAEAEAKLTNLRTRSWMRCWNGRTEVQQVIYDNGAADWRAAWETVVAPALGIAGAQVHTRMRSEECDACACGEGEDIIKRVLINLPLIMRQWLAKGTPRG